MDYARVVSCAHGIERLQYDSNHLTPRDGAIGRQQRADIAALEQLHDDEGSALLGDADIHHADDVVALNAKRRSPLAQEPLFAGFRQHGGAPEELQRDRVLEHQVPGSENHTHAAMPHDSLDFVLALDDVANLRQNDWGGAHRGNDGIRVWSKRADRFGDETSALRTHPDVGISALPCARIHGVGDEIEHVVLREASLVGAGAGCLRGRMGRGRRWFSMRCHGTSLKKGIAQQRCTCRTNAVSLPSACSINGSSLRSTPAGSSLKRVEPPDFGLSHAPPGSQTTRWRQEALSAAIRRRMVASRLLSINFMTPAHSLADQSDVAAKRRRVSVTKPSRALATHRAAVAR